MYYLHTETQEKYFEDVIRLHKSGCSNGAISRLLPVDKTTVSKWISIFVREKGQIMRVKRTEKLVDPDGLRVPEPSMDEMESLRRRVKELESQLLQTEIKSVRSKDPGIGGVKLWHMYRREFPADVRVGRDSFMSCAITTDSLH